MSKSLTPHNHTHTHTHTHTHDSPRCALLHLAPFSTITLDYTFIPPRLFLHTISTHALSGPLHLSPKSSLSRHTYAIPTYTHVPSIILHCQWRAPGKQETNKDLLANRASTTVHVGARGSRRNGHDDVGAQEAPVSERGKPDAEYTTLT